MTRIPPLAFETFALCLALIVGCDSGGPAAPDGADGQARTNLALLSMEYGEYMNAHNGAAPPNPEAFRGFMASRPGAMESYNVKNPDEIMKSPRDGEPFVIVCGKKVAPPDSPQTPWVAYEKTGVDGKRLAASFRGPLVELPSSELAKQIPGAK